MSVTLNDLNAMAQSQLDTLFTSSAAGPIPDGDAKGAAIILPGTICQRPLAVFATYGVWQGKVFDTKRGELINKILPFGMRAIRAKVYKAPSWVDNKECIVLDYSQTSFLFGKIRDEIREVSPRIYLGVVFIGKKKTINFALEFPAGSN